MSAQNLVILDSPDCFGRKSCIPPEWQHVRYFGFGRPFWKQTYTLSILFEKLRKNWNNLLAFLFAVLTVFARQIHFHNDRYYVYNWTRRNILDHWQNPPNNIASCREKHLTDSTSCCWKDARLRECHPHIQYGSLLGSVGKECAVISVLALHLTVHTILHRIR